MKWMTLQCKKEDAQLVSNSDHLRQTRPIHLNRKHFLRVLQRIKVFGRTTVNVSQGKEEMCLVRLSVCAARSSRRGRMERKKELEGRGCIYMLGRKGASNDGWYQSGKDWQQANSGHRGFHTTTLAQPFFSVGPLFLRK